MNRPAFFDRSWLRAASFGFVGLLLAAGCGGSTGKKDTGVDAAEGEGGQSDVAPIPAKLEITPTTKDFGAAVVGQPATSNTSFQVKNVGLGTSGFLTSLLGGTNPGEFTKVSDGCNNVELMPGAACAVTISFTPTSAGAKTAALGVGSTVVGKEVGVMATLQGNGVAPARFVVDPLTKDFGSVVSGQSSPAVKFTISNAGGLDTSVPVINSAAPFIITSNGCKTALAPLATCIVEVQFSPTQVGVQAGSLNINTASATAAGGSTNANLSGTGIAPGGLTITPSLKDFGLVLVGASSAATTFTITNTGGAPVAGLDTGLMVSSQFAKSNITCTATLGPGLSCSVDVKFSPTSTGSKSGSLTVSGTGAASISAALTGDGQADAALTMAPTNRSYGSVTVGSISTAAGFTVTNKGDVISGTLATTLTGTNPGDFAIASTGCTGSLAAAGSCQIDITFSPTATGARSAILTVSGTPGGTVTANLSGVGITPGAITIDPTPVDFGKIPLDGVSTSTTLTVTNTGQSPTGALNTSLGGNNPGQFTVISVGNGCQSAVLAPGGKCTIAVVFSPTLTPGAKSATLNVTASPGGTTQAVLTGTGINNARLMRSPTQQDFGSVAIGAQSFAVDITVTNTGDVSTGTLTTGLTGMGAAQFEITANGCTVLAAGASCHIFARFAPLNSVPVGPKTAEIAVSGTPGGAVTVQLTGLAVDPGSLVLGPSPVAFGKVMLDSHLDQVFDLTNNGAANSGAIGVNLLGGNGVGFSILNNTCSFLLQGNTCHFTVRFRPAAVGDQTATVHVSAAAGLLADAAVSGTGVKKLSISPLMWDATPDSDFPVPARALDGPVQAFTVLCNPGEGAFDAGTTCGGTNGFANTADANGQFLIIGNNCSGQKIGANGGTCTISVRFTPTATGNDKAFTLRVTSTDPKQDVSATLSGDAVDPFTITPAAHPFGDVEVGTFGDSGFVVKYDGRGYTLPATLALSTVLEGANRDQFALYEDSCAGNARVTGGTCAVGVRFVPTTITNPDKAAILTVSGISDVTGDLYGDGVNRRGVFPRESVTGSLSGRAVLGPQIFSDVAAVDFGDVITGSTSATKTVTIWNRPSAGTTGKVMIGAVTTAGMSVTGGTCTPSGTVGLTAGASCTITLAFAPLIQSPTGPRTDNLAVSASPGGQITIALTGNAISPISIAPTSHGFGALAQNGTADKVFTIKNNSASALTSALSVSILSSHAPVGLGGPVNPFASVVHDCVGLLEAGGTCSATVTFSAGSGNTTFAFTDSLSADATNAHALAALTGSRLGAAQLAFEPGEDPGRDFGTVHIGALSASTQTFTVVNNGGVTSNALATDLSAQFSIAAGGSCVAGVTTLAPTERCEFLVRFAPAGPAGNVMGTFQVTAAGTLSNTATVDLMGIAQAAAQIIIDPTPRYFGVIVDGQAGGAVDFTVSNPDTGVTTDALGTSIVGSTAFEITTDGCAAVVLAPGADCHILARFAPNGENPGDLLTGTLKVDGGMAAGVATAALSGKVSQPATLVVAPGTLEFGEVLTGQASSAHTFTAINPGDDGLDLFTRVLSGADKSHYEIVSDNCGAALSAHTACTFGVRFKPTTSGTKNATLTVKGDGVGSPKVYALTGEGLTVVSLGITPDSWTTATAVVGSALSDCGGIRMLTLNPPCIYEHVFTVSNLVGSVPTTNLVVTVNNPNFRILDSTCGAVLGGGEECHVLVGLRPQAIGAFTASLVVSDGGAGEVSVPILDGKGVSALTSNPAAGSFGNVAVGGGGGITFTITNDSSNEDTLGPVSTLLDQTNGNQFAIVSDTCAGVYLQPDDSCGITVRCVPTSIGPKAGTLHITPPGVSTATVALTCEGVTGN